MSRSSAELGLGVRQLADGESAEREQAAASRRSKPTAVPSDKQNKCPELSTFL
ncbi:hypothetical protein HY227_02725 [Candidatus Wolfebacteria bacterium]|nr:hypothetical protein [Candidatus Wolfebacteria bacterium]